jgi:hypothetical protein
MADDGPSTQPLPKAEEILDRYIEVTGGAEAYAALRTIVTRSTDREIDALIDAMASDDVQAVIRRTARFNWHRSLILAMLRQPGIKSLLVRALFR